MTKANIGNPFIFLGGTCNESTWREELMPQLKMNYFNPVVDDWSEDDYQKELVAREQAEYVLYVITPNMTGVYSIAELIDDVHMQPDKTVFCYLEHADGCTSFDNFQLKSFSKIGIMVEKRGGTWLKSLEEVAEYFNSKI